MLTQIPEVLTAEQVARARRLLDGAEWVDGRVTAGHQSAKAKDNAQLPEDSPVARQLGQMILAALERNGLRDAEVEGRPAVLLQSFEE